MAIMVDMFALHHTWFETHGAGCKCSDGKVFNLDQNNTCGIALIYSAGPGEGLFMQLLNTSLIKSTWPRLCHCANSSFKNELMTTWWRHQMETFSVLLAICAGNSMNSPHKGQWRGALIFSLICPWINGWVNNGEVGDFRRHRAIMTSM